MEGTRRSRRARYARTMAATATADAPHVDPERGPDRRRGGRARRARAGQRRAGGPDAHGRADRAGQHLHEVQRDPRRDAGDHPGGRSPAGRAVRPRADRERGHRHRAGAASQAHPRPAHGAHGAEGSGGARRRRARGGGRRGRARRRARRRAGSEIVVDGEVLTGRGLEVDESLLTGEADPVDKAAGDQVLSGSFVAAGAGRYRATKVGAEAYAVQLAEDARRFTLTRSELRSGIDTILTYVTFAIVPTAALLFFSQLRACAAAGARRSSGAVAGTVAMVPEGLVLLTSLAFAVAVVRLAQRQRARAGAAGRRGPRPGRRAVHRQDRHAHRGQARRGGRRAGRRTTRAGLADGARRRSPATDPSPNATTASDRGALSARRAGWRADRRACRSRRGGSGAPAAFDGPRARGSSVPPT